MVRHPVKKIFGLTLLYGIIIIGIFVLQFKNESLLSRNIGLLRMTVAQTQLADGSTALKNTLRVSFRGIEFTADDAMPALLLRNAQEPMPLTLISWEQHDGNAYTFQFSDDVALTFAVSDETDDASLAISAQLPPDGEQLSLTYKPATGYSVTEQSVSHQLVSSKNTEYVLTAPTLAGETLSFSKTALTASYALFVPATTFAFDVVPASAPLASQGAYEDTVQRVKDGIASVPAQTMQDPSQGNETAIIAYLSEQLSRGQYSTTLARIPDSFRRSTRRTYLSAPFFDSLVSMNRSLTMVNDNMRGMIQNAIAQESLAIFDINGLADYMVREDTAPDVRSLAALPASLAEFAPTVEQAGGILSVYVALAATRSATVELLAPVIPTCLETIQDSCVFENDTLLLVEKEELLPFLPTVKTGKTLLDYGIHAASQAHQICGRLLINTAFAQSPDLNTRVLADVYPLLAENPFYPHYSVLGTFGTSKVWSWSAARRITYEENATGSTGTITIDFPTNDTHYLIIRGIRPFETIEIYGMPFRTDPRFESYNSSGYAYNEQTQTLFLKSRHKTERETVRLTYRRPRITPRPNPQPAQPAAASTSAPQATAPAQPADAPQATEQAAANTAQASTE